MDSMIFLQVKLMRKGAVQTSREWQSLIKRLEPYWAKWIPKNVYDLYYILPEKNSLLTELKTLALQYAKYVMLVPQYMWVEYTEEEAERFAGFIPLFFRGHYCNEYDDVESVFEECDICHARWRFKESVLWNGKTFGENRLIMPDSYIKKHRNDNFVMRINAEDGTDLISVTLHDNLLKLGEDPSFFKEVRSKRGETLAYEFYSDVILPPGAVYSDGYIKNKECVKCGVVSYINDNRLEYNPVFMKADCAKNLSTVAFTIDCYYRKPLIILSAKLGSEIKQLCPDALFLPVEIETSSK